MLNNYFIVVAKHLTVSVISSFIVLRSLEYYYKKI
jgi:hypothetical protein